MTDIIHPLVLPTIIVAGATWLIIKSISNTQEAENPTPVITEERVTLNIFKGNQALTLSVENSLTPQQIGEMVFNSEELINKVPIVIWNGKKLYNEMSIGLQGVKNGQFLHIQKVDKLAVREQSHNNYNLVTLAACSFVLTGFWWIYFGNPEFFSFFSRLLMIGFTEILAVVMFKVIKSNR
jgi:hypothetical protein